MTNEEKLQDLLKLWGKVRKDPRQIVKDELKRQIDALVELLADKDVVHDNS